MKRTFKRGDRLTVCLLPRSKRSTSFPTTTWPHVPTSTSPPPPGSAVPLWPPLNAARYKTMPPASRDHCSLVANTYPLTSVLHASFSTPPNKQPSPQPTHPSLALSPQNKHSDQTPPKRTNQSQKERSDLHGIYEKQYSKSIKTSHLLGNSTSRTIHSYPKEATRQMLLAEKVAF